MADSRDFAAQRIAWIDDDVEIRDLDPTLDLDVFADVNADAPAFARSPQVAEVIPPRQRLADRQPLPDVVADDQIAVPPPVVVTFPRAAPEAEMQALIASLRGDTPRTPAAPDREDEKTEPPRWQAVPPVAGAKRPARDSGPLAMAAGLLVLVTVGGGAFLWSQRAPKAEGPAANNVVARGAAPDASASSAGTLAAQGSSERPATVRPVRTRLATGTAPRALSSSSSPAAARASSSTPGTSKPAHAFGGAVATAGHVEGTTSRAMPSARAPRPAPPPRDANGALAGWLRVDAASELQLTVDGVALGSTRQAPRLLAAGTHVVELASDRAGVRTATRVTVVPGQVAVVPITLPQGTLSVTAQPDADVFVDGQPAGRTPVDHVALTVGVRRILVRHPEFGERSYEVVVREGQQTQLSVDLRPR